MSPSHSGTPLQTPTKFQAEPQVIWSQQQCHQQEVWAGCREIGFRSHRHRPRKEGSLIPQRGHRAGPHTSSNSKRAACICKSLSCAQSIVMYITFDLPHISRKGLGRHCSHLKDEEAEATWAGCSLLRSRAGRPRTHSPEVSSLTQTSLSAFRLSSTNLQQPAL